MAAKKGYTPEERRLARNATARQYRADHPELKALYAERRKQLEKVRKETDPNWLDKHRQAVREYRARNTEQARERCRVSIRRIQAKSYGCPPEYIDQWDSACAHGCCDICGRSAAESAKGRLHRDHAHTNPPVPRGCLCDRCNHGLGKFQDSPDLLEAAARYLRARDPRYRP